MLQLELDRRNYQAEGDNLYTRRERRSRNAIGTGPEVSLDRIGLRKSYPAPTQISILQDTGLSTMIAIRTSDTEITISIPYTAPDILSPVDEDKDATLLTIDDVETDDDWGKYAL
ncbi:hypothetical protein EIK77_004351 [Talaromyces pinophilus]|nr:hypothetical protein EIK77_004351 [Talaromyces pinophilus]